jgi:flagellar P-ring protein precursor FlgI
MMRCLLAALLVSLIGSGANAAARIKDITAVQGVRANQLVGYGLVVGLNGTGDSLRNSPFTEQSLQSMLDTMGINIRAANSRRRICRRSRAEDRASTSRCRRSETRRRSPAAPWC